MCTFQCTNTPYFNDTNPNFTANILLVSTNLLSIPCSFRSHVISFAGTRFKVIMYQSLRISAGRCAIILDFYGGGVFRSVPGKILHLKGHSSFCKIDSYTRHTCGVAYFFSPHDWVSSKTFSGIVLLCSKYDKTVKLFNKYMCQTFSKRVFDLHLKIINHIFKITSSKLNSYTS